MRPYLRAERLTLRRFTADDVDNLFELNSDPEVMRYLTGGKPTPRERSASRGTACVGREPGSCWR